MKSIDKLLEDCFGHLNPVQYGWDDVSLALEKFADAVEQTYPNDGLRANLCILGACDMLSGFTNQDVTEVVFGLFKIREVE